MTEQELERCLPWLRSLAEGRGDPVVRGQFADWLDDHGLADEAKGQRWAAARGKRPTSMGWWLGNSDPKYDDCHELPMPFWDKNIDTSLADDELYHIEEGDRYLYYECAYLLRCGEMLWGDGGEPLARDKPSPAAETCPQ